MSTSAAAAAAQQDAKDDLSPALVQRILQQHFVDPDKTRLSQASVTMVTEYMKTFIKEAIWRSVAEKKGVDDPTEDPQDVLDMEDVEAGVITEEEARERRKERRREAVKRGLRELVEKEHLERVLVQLVLDF